MKKLKHIMRACWVSKIAILVCILLVGLDVVAGIFFCEIIKDILIGITTGLVATLTFYIYTKYMDSITSILTTQHITTLFLDDIFDSIISSDSKKVLLKRVKEYQYDLSVLSYKITYKKDFYVLLKKISDLVDAINNKKSNYTKELNEIAKARELLIE